MSKFTTIEIGKIDESITRAATKVARRFPRLAQSIGDICQDAWIKVLANYDRDTDRDRSAVRVGREIDARLDGQGRTWRDGKIHESAKHVHAIGASPFAPEAFAYVVATRVATDYARNLVRKHDAAHMGLDAPTGKGKGHDDLRQTLADTLADALDGADVSMVRTARLAAVRAALAKLSDSQLAALEAWLDGRTMTGAERIGKMRAIEAIQEEVSNLL